jgi:GntR family carbon starvation induced transcriptional regulator
MSARTGRIEEVSKARLAASPSNVYYRSLKDDILSGRLRPGLKLTTAFLYERYKAGIGTMREALAALQTEGLVEANLGRGFWVATMSEADLRDVSALYIEFEQRAVVESVRHGDESWEIRVLSSYHRLARLEALTREERIERSAEWLECHRAFHLELVSACPSPWLLRMRAVLFDHMERYRLVSQKHRPLSTHKRREHELIRDAALCRRADEAGMLVRDHLQETTDTVLKYASYFLAGD